MGEELLVHTVNVYLGLEETLKLLSKVIIELCAPTSNKRSDCSVPRQHLVLSVSLI